MLPSYDHLVLLETVFAFTIFPPSQPYFLNLRQGRGHVWALSYWPILSVTLSPCALHGRSSQIVRKWVKLAGAALSFGVGPAGPRGKSSLDSGDSNHLTIRNRFPGTSHSSHYISLSFLTLTFISSFSAVSNPCVDVAECCRVESMKYLEDPENVLRTSLHRFATRLSILSTLTVAACLFDGSTGSRQI